LRSLAAVHPVGRLLRDAADGHFPPVDGAWHRVPQWRPGLSAVLALTGHAVFAVHDILSDDTLAALGANGFGGMGGLAEMSIELPTALQGRGIGRELIADTRHLVPAGKTPVAAVAPGNAASVRSFLAAGFRPVGSVQLFRSAGSPNAILT
jgi:RimJ/RimL family protein N-acetyltransferase